MARIKLANTGNYATIDDEFYPLVKELVWHEDSHGYAVTTYWCKKEKKTGGRVKMHKYVSMCFGRNVDHINGNRLDNRLINLRPASHAQNLWNGPVSKNNKSGFKGVCFDKRKSKYKAEICKHRKREFLGYFETPEEAAAAYDRRAVVLFGEFANINDITSKF